VFLLRGSVGSGGYGTLFCLPRLIKVFSQKFLETKKMFFFPPYGVYFCQIFPRNENLNRVSTKGFGGEWGLWYFILSTFLN